MIDFTHKKRPEFVQLVLIIAVVCLALGAITPAASAVDYEDLTYGSSEIVSGTVNIGDTRVHVIPNALPGGISLYCQQYLDNGYSGHYALLTEFINNLGIYTDFPNTATEGGLFYYTYYVLYSDIGSPSTSSEVDVYVRLIAEFLLNNTDIPSSRYFATKYMPPSHPYELSVYLFAPSENNYAFESFNYSYDPYAESLDLSLTAFAPDDPSGMYVLSLDGSLLDTTYTVGINRYTSEFEYLIDSYAYTDGSGSYTFTGSRSLTFPIFYNSFTNMPYSYEVSINVNDENGYLDTRYLVYWSDLGGLYDTVPDPLVPTPTPTVTFVPPGPVVPSDIIPPPGDLNNTINITGWYQDQGFESNSITAPIYDGLRGFFTSTLIPVFDFFLMPIGSLGTMISDSAGTAIDAIDDSVEQLSGYAAPMSMVGGYVVLLVPDVVWVVVFAALTIGYAVLLIRITTGSIRDTINRFLGGR